MSLYPNEFGEPGKAPNDPQSTTLNEQFLEKGYKPVTCGGEDGQNGHLASLCIKWQCDLAM